MSKSCPNDAGPKPVTSSGGRAALPRFQDEIAADLADILQDICGPDFEVTAEREEDEEDEVAHG
jgi:hypothetical protein